MGKDHEIPAISCRNDTYPIRSGGELKHPSDSAELWQAGKSLTAFLRGGGAVVFNRHLGATQEEHRRVVEKFPNNIFLQRLIEKAEAMGVMLAPCPVEAQWLYQPDQRTIYVWEDDLKEQSLSYLVVILAHELGHAADFDQRPQHRKMIRGVHWSEVPIEVEIAAFVEGFRILKELWIPVSLDQYQQMIEPSISTEVRRQIEADYLCCLMSTTPNGQKQREVRIKSAS